ncbi:glucokinase [Lysobacter sp. Root916]|uniref:glucokinase n=1 Tax=Lysobacter sp. Root916 TaxID=1736606 RepID=UPI000A9557BC|nr:glucokinase [Lysobacter sp. Root916]
MPAVRSNAAVLPAPAAAGTPVPRRGETALAVHVSEPACSPAMTVHPKCAQLRDLIAADVGGTHARVGHVRVGDDGTLSVLRFRQYACAQAPSLAAILRDFAEEAQVAPEHAVVAIAGRLDGDRLLNSNLPWPVSLERTRLEAGCGQLALLNDFEAVAYAVPRLDPARMLHICGDAAANAGPALVLGPGTGFGAALYVPGSPARVLASEAGHAALAAGTPRELDLLRQLLQRWPHVDNERVLSGPGLVHTYEALCALDAAPPRLDTPEAIAAAAQRGDDAQAVEALSIFCAMLGSLAGDLAVTFGAQSVYLAGGIPAQIAPFLLASDFAARFRNKGVFAELMARTPVRLVEHGQRGLLGAAAYYLERHAGD